MVDQYVVVAPDSTGKKIDTAELTVNAQTVERQRMVVGDNATAANYLAIDASGNAAIVDRDISATGSITTLNANLATGAPTANSTVSVIAAGGEGCASIQVTGTWTGTLQPQGTVDGTNWVNLGPLSLTNITTNALSATIVSAAVGIWQCDVGGFEQFRVTASAAMTGTAVVTVQLSGAASMVGLDAPVVQHQDVSRSPVTIFLDEITSGMSATEALLSSTMWRGFTSTTATSFSVTAGKTLRITSMSITCRSTGAAQEWVRVRLRAASGTLATTSAVVLSLSAASTNTTNAMGFATASITDGYEIPSAYNFGISHIALSTNAQGLSATITGFEY